MRRGHADDDNPEQYAVALENRVRAELENLASERARNRVTYDGEYTYDIYAEEEWYDREWLRLVHNLSRCQSPPEQLLSLALDKHTRDELGEKTWRFHVTHQYEVPTGRGLYRLDFVVDYWPIADTEVTVAVEVDGHNWHERTPMQAARDKSRDRALVSSGFPVLRFTASEVWRVPEECASEILAVLKDMWSRMKVGHFPFGSFAR